MEYNLPAGGVNSDILLAEIVASGSVTSPSVTVGNDKLTIGGTVTNQSTLDAVIAAHDPSPLSVYKAAKNAAIDAKTQALIRQGFTFDGRSFSLSVNAQMNWSGLKTFEGLLSWPVAITTNDDSEYSLSQANLTAFTGTGLGTVSAHYGSGRALKLQVNAATSKTEVDAVVDNR